MPVKKKFPKDGKIIADAVAELGKRNLPVTPANLVEVARAVDHPLHAYFEWDDSRAAESYRRLQAYKMIAGLHTATQVISGVPEDIYVDANESSLRMFLPVRDGENVYVERQRAKENPDVRRKNVAAFLSELRAWCRRTRDFEELDPVRSAVEEALGE
jgi:hypothetical protein